MGTVIAQPSPEAKAFDRSAPIMLISNSVSDLLSWFWHEVADLMPEAVEARLIVGLI